MTGFLKDHITAKDALQQATQGLEHLHSLGKLWPGETVALFYSHDPLLIILRNIQ